jgi:hypothetical protein
VSLNGTFEGHDWQLIEGVPARSVVIYGERTYHFDEIGDCGAIFIGLIPGDDDDPFAEFSAQMNCTDGTTLDLKVDDVTPILGPTGRLAGWEEVAQGTANLVG